MYFILKLVHTSFIWRNYHYNVVDSQDFFGESLFKFSTYLIIDGAMTIFKVSYFFFNDTDKFQSCTSSD